MDALTAESLPAALQQGDVSADALVDQRLVCVCTIRKPASELYAFWTDLANLPQLALVPLEFSTSGEATHWVARAPRGRQHLEWDLMVTQGLPSKSISWQSPPGSTPAHRGSIGFAPAPGDEGTEVSLTIEISRHDRPTAAWTSPTGGLASWVTKIKGQGLKYHVNEALRRFKALMEAGEIPTTQGQPSGNRGRRS
jgi:uncharacterized membrane protein